MLHKQPKSDKWGCIPLWMTDRDIALPPKERKASRKLLDGSGRYEKGVKMSQEGTVAFGKKKKNACKLASKSVIRHSVNQNAKRWTNYGNCADVLPKIKLDASDLTV